VEPRDHGEHDGEIEGQYSEIGNPENRSELMEEDGGNGCDLDQRVCFAKDARTELPTTDCCIKNGGDNEDSDIPAEDEDCNPGGDQSFVCEDKKKRTEKELVGYRVKIAAKHGALTEEARERAIERVCEASSHEKSKAEGVAVFKNGCDQKWSNTDPEQREDVRRSPKGIQARSRFFRDDRLSSHLTFPH
jgi:hypothetical protein